MGLRVRFRSPIIIPSAEENSSLKEGSGSEPVSLGKNKTATVMGSVSRRLPARSCRPIIISSSDEDSSSEPVSLGQNKTAAVVESVPRSRRPDDLHSARARPIVSREALLGQITGSQGNTERRTQAVQDPPPVSRPTGLPSLRPADRRRRGPAPTVDKSRKGPGTAAADALLGSQHRSESRARSNDSRHASRSEAKASTPQARQQADLRRGHKHGIGIGRTRAAGGTSPPASETVCVNSQSSSSLSLR